MLSSTRLLSLALLLVSTLNAAAAPTPLSQDADLVERQLPRNVADGHSVLMERAPPRKAPTRAPNVPVKTPGKTPANPPPGKGPGKAPTPPGGPSKPPSRPGTPPPTKKPKGPPKGQACSTIQDCASCINNNVRGGPRCHFDKVTFTCANAGGNTLNKVTTRTGCPQMLQMQKVFPKSGTTRAGVVPAALNTKFQQVRQHVLVGETNNPNAGRHTLTSFLQTHAGATPTSVNNNNRLQQFNLAGGNPKTVWKNGPGEYTELDIKNMCATAAEILRKNGAVGGAGGTIGAVVQSPFGTPACVTFTEFSGQPTSCFPIGVFNPPRTAKLGGLCSGSQAA